jgi:hypothetical protein
MLTLVWRPEALDDLEAVMTYISARDIAALRMGRSDRRNAVLCAGVRQCRGQGAKSFRVRRWPP